jgi:hypothetical protein
MLRKLSSLVVGLGVALLVLKEIEFSRTGDAHH